MGYRFFTEVWNRVWKITELGLKQWTGFKFLGHTPPPILRNNPPPLLWAGIRELIFVYFFTGSAGAFGMFTCYLSTVVLCRFAWLTRIHSLPLKASAECTSRTGAIIVDLNIERGFSRFAWLYLAIGSLKTEFPEWPAGQTLAWFNLLEVITNSREDEVSRCHWEPGNYGPIFLTCWPIKRRNRLPLLPGGERYSHI